MTGPYEYVAPSYWLLDTKYGSAHGFNTETSPGPAPLPVESLIRILPHDHLWPMDSWWDYHAAGKVSRRSTWMGGMLFLFRRPSNRLESFLARFAQLRLFGAGKSAQMLPAFVGCRPARGCR